MKKILMFACAALLTCSATEPILDADLPAGKFVFRPGEPVLVRFQMKKAPDNETRNYFLYWICTGTDTRDFGRMPIQAGVPCTVQIVPDKPEHLRITGILLDAAERICWTREGLPCRAAIDAFAESDEQKQEKQNLEERYSKTDKPTNEAEKHEWSVLPALRVPANAKKQGHAAYLVFGDAGEFDVPDDALLLEFSVRKAFPKDGETTIKKMRRRAAECVRILAGHPKWNRKTLILAGSGSGAMEAVFAAVSPAGSRHATALRLRNPWGFGMSRRNDPPVRIQSETDVLSDAPYIRCPTELECGADMARTDAAGAMEFRALLHVRSKVKWKEGANQVLEMTFSGRN